MKGKPLTCLCRWADKLSGQTLKHALPVLAYTLREPLGVCALITPWNFPLGLLGMKLAAALACGNTVVAKVTDSTLVVCHILVWEADIILCFYKFAQ